MSLLNRFMRRVYEDSRMTIKHRTYTQTLTNFTKDAFDHRNVSNHTRLALPIVRKERLGCWIDVSDPIGRYRFGDEEQYFFCLFNMCACLKRNLTCKLYTRSYDSE